MWHVNIHKLHGMLILVSTCDMFVMSIRFTITLIQSLCYKMYYVQQSRIKCIILIIEPAFVNGDGRSDIVCTADGGIMVWEAKDVNDNANIYDSNSKWMDVNFGFCAQNDKEVIF